MAASTDLATTEGFDITSLSEGLQNLLTQNEGEGLEGVGPEGFALPFLKLLQGLSPEVQLGDDTYVEGARPGLIIDSVTKELFEAVEVIPAHIRSRVIEWAPRNQGGGFVAEYESRDEAEEYVTPGNELKDTITYAVLYRGVGESFYRAALLSMDSTKMKVARNWNTQLDMLRVPVEKDGETLRVKPPIFMTRWLLSSIRQENAKGKFNNFSVRSLGLVDDSDVIESALKLRDAVDQMPVRGKDGDLEEPEVGEGGDSSF